MNFKNRCFDSCNGIRKSYRSMGISSGIQKDGIITESYLMDFINEFALHIALVIAELHFRKPGLELMKIFFKGSATVNFWLPLSQKIEIRAVDYDDFQDSYCWWFRVINLSKVLV